MLDLQQARPETGTVGFRDRLTAIFSDSLERPVRPEDDFFEVGGTSLLAMSVVMEIEKLVGRELPISILHEAPSIDALAARLDAAQPVANPMVVPLRPGPPGPGLFIAAGLGGAVVELRDFAARIRADVPVFGLESPSLHGYPLQRRVEDLAALSVDAVRAAQPQGPYLLAGYSFGGLVAIEIARGLLAAGQQVRFLGLIDSYLDEGLTLRRIRQRLARYVTTPPPELVTELAKTRSRIALRLHGRAGGETGALPPRLSLPERIEEVRQASLAAQFRYRPHRLPLHATFVCPTVRLPGAPGDPRRMWGPLLGGLTVETVEGDHSTMIRPGTELGVLFGRHLRLALA